ncbi:unnamed protein product, partial [Gongylonema pulchrum]|uniref:Tyrosine-protein phosphatase domain-containing protein n=1 Tax=Gongylonema pulchrum TaxID=637853 RepID=A0A183D126_9BILA
TEIELVSPSVSGEDQSSESGSAEAGAIKLEASSLHPLSTDVNDNFEDLKERISKKTLDLIRRLHTQYLNTANLRKGRTFPSSGENSLNKEEIVHIAKNDYVFAVCLADTVQPPPQHTDPMEYRNFQNPLEINSGSFTHEIWTLVVSSGFLYLKANS